MTNIRKRKSAVWEYFDEPRDFEENSDDTTSRRKIPCKLCNIKLADGEGTSNLKSHLEAKHPQEHQRLVNSEADKKKQKPQQSVLSHGTLRVCGAQRVASITDRLAAFVALDLRPLRVVEGAGFKQQMNYIEPVYVVPSRTHITSVCRKKYHAIKTRSI